LRKGHYLNPERQLVGRSAPSRFQEQSCSAWFPRFRHLPAVWERWSRILKAAPSPDLFFWVAIGSLQAACTPDPHVGERKGQVLGAWICFLPLECTAARLF
jgi:hypothetical protein